MQGHRPTLIRKELTRTPQELIPLLTHRQRGELGFLQYTLLILRRVLSNCIEFVIGC